MVKTLGNPHGRILLDKYALLDKRVLLQRRILSVVVALLFALSLFCLSVVAVFGQNSATAAVGFLRFAPDAAHQAMGRTGTGERFNTNAAFWNIAAAAPEYETGTNPVNPDTAKTYLFPTHAALAAQVAPIAAPDAFLLYGTVQGIRLGRGSLVVSGTYFRIPRNGFHEYAIAVGYATAVSEELNLGIQAKFVQSNLPVNLIAQTWNIGRTFGMDIGVVYTPMMLFGSPTSKRVSFGATLKNLGPSMTYTHAADPQPLEFRAGVARKYSARMTM